MEVNVAAVRRRTTPLPGARERSGHSQPDKIKHIAGKSVRNRVVHRHEASCVETRGVIEQKSAEVIVPDRRAGGQRLARLNSDIRDIDLERTEPVPGSRPADPSEIPTTERCYGCRKWNTGGIGAKRR